MSGPLVGRSPDLELSSLQSWWPASRWPAHGSSKPAWVYSRDGLRIPRAARRVSHEAEALSRSLLVSCVSLTQQLKQVTWPSPEPGGEGPPEGRHMVRTVARATSASMLLSLLIKTQKSKVTEAGKLLNKKD